MDEISATHEVLLVEIVLYPDILHVHFSIGITHVNLTLPLTIGETYANTHVGDTNTRFQLVILM